MEKLVINDKMKKHTIIILIIIMLSCTSKKTTTYTIKKTPIHQSINSTSNISEIELNIVNDFLEDELKSDRYKSYENFNFFVIEEARKKSNSLYAYEFSYKEFYKQNKERDFWLLDSLQIKKKKEELEFEKQYYWKVTDFKNIKVSLLKYEEFREIIKKGQYVDLPNRLIIHLSTPLIIDDKNALISFDIGNGNLGYGAIKHFTVLMKQVGDKWIQYEFFDDGVIL